MNIKQEIVLIENGDLFKGTFDQFEDSFFSFPKNLSNDDKLNLIKDWCNSNKFEFSWSCQLTSCTNDN